MTYTWNGILSSLKRDEILTYTHKYKSWGYYAVKWASHKEIKYCMIPIMGSTSNTKNHRQTK